MIVRRRCSRHRAALAVCGVPAFGQAVKVSNDRARGDPVVVLVGVEHGRVTVPELEGRSCFPFVAEPVNGGELVNGCGVAEFAEHATAPDGLKLIGVTHQHHPPTLLIRQESELVQCGGGDHAGFVHDQRGAGGEAVAGFGLPVGPRVFV